MTHIEQRYGTAAQWTAANPVLNAGEAGHESDTGKWKMGNGVLAWNSLLYKSGVDSVAGKTGAVSLVVADVAGAAPLASPAFTGTPTAPTQNGGDNTTRVATTAHVKAALLASPALGGTPTAPTQATAANGTAVATTAFVKNQGYAPTVSPALTGAPTAPTQANTDNSTRIATTAFVKSVKSVVLGRYSQRVSAIPFGGFPANNTRYSPAAWVGVAVPAGSEYVLISAKLDARALGNAAIMYWLAATVNGGAYADLITEEHYNNSDQYVSLSANLTTSMTLASTATTVSVKLDGSASGVAVGTFYANLNLTFMGQA